jgi:class 3 adenylate cyclase
MRRRRALVSPLLRARDRLRAALSGARRQRGPAPEIVLLEREIRAINRFPDQNPNPVMRMSEDGYLLYANPASEPIRRALRLEVGAPVPADTLGALRRAAVDPSRPVVEVEWNHRTYAVLPVAIPDFGFVNLYGTDVTATKLVNKFPDQNPNPVFRVTDDGRLIYANGASRPLIDALGRQVGDTLPPALFKRIRRAAAGSEPQRLELQGDGRTYALKPVPIPEFGLINVYGTDVTALKALDKFPDQNPNPVLRVATDGSLQYANAASALVTKAFGVRVGDPLPPELLAEIRVRAASADRGTIEVESEGRIFALLVVQVYEFGFINLYGTDITAAREIEKANRENERLLLNILPEPVARRLREGERIIADRFDEVTLLFADIVGFTQRASGMSPIDVVGVLNHVFSLFDQLVERHSLEKIKTIGDAYMVVGGLPPRMDDHAARVAEMALDLNDAVAHLGATPWPIEFRIGIHTGPAVAGVIGVKKFIYDVWGDTVNTASRMESHSVPGRIQVTQSVYERLCDRYHFQPRGVIDVRGKGPMTTYFLLGRRDKVARGADDGRTSPGANA